MVGLFKLYCNVAGILGKIPLVKLYCNAAGILGKMPLGMWRMPGMKDTQR